MMTPDHCVPIKFASNFFKKGRLIVLCVGDNASLSGMFQSILGSEFIN